MKNKNHLDHFTVVKILKKFSQKEMNEFEKMINSPFFNNNIVVSNLFKVLKKYHPDFSDSEISKQLLFRLATKKNKYNDKLFRKYLSLINKLAEEYLFILNSRSNLPAKEIKILEQMSQRNTDDAYKRKLNSLKKLFSNKKIIDLSDFYLLHNLFVIEHNYNNSHNNIVSLRECGYNSYINLIYYFIFNSISIINQLESDVYSFEDINYVSNIGEIIDRTILENMINALKKITSPKDKYLNLFLDLTLNDLKMNSSDSGINAYRDLFNLINIYQKRLSRDVLFYYMQRMIVFCTLENVKGKYDLTKEIFENYKFQFKNNLFTLYTSDKLDFLNFRLIINSALKNNEFEWAEEFIMDNINKVKEDSRTNILNYAKAVMCFYKNEFTESLNFISNIKHELLPITLDMYILKIKIFYRLGYLDSVRSQTDSFRHFIKNNKLISDYHKVTLLNFLKFFKTILRLSVKADKIRLNEVIDQIKSSKDTKERKWMLEIAEELLLRNNQNSNLLRKFPA